MKNKKGFTLIELLAVIVVLAVIMVIAVPKILDIINSSRESAAESSIKLVKDAIKTQVSTGQMSGVSFEKEGECYLFDFENNNNNALNLSLKNKDKIGGSIKYCNGKFEEDTLTFDGTSISNKELKICKRATILHTEACNQTSNCCSSAGYANGDTITYGNLGTSGILTSGDAFDCDVNGDGTYDSEKERFYYVTDLEENSNVAVLIYYNNVSVGEPNNTSTYAYDSSGRNNNGPVTAIKQLPSTTKWGNISLKKESRTITNEIGGNTTSGGTLPSNFSYSGYTARLLTTGEIESSCNMTVGNYVQGELEECIYLMENTIFSSNGLNEGYALETPYSSNSSSIAFVHGVFRLVNLDSASNSKLYGVRPAIEILKSDISY